ncbi:MAG: type I-E CRISPR-associated protein Cse2/CasB [Candidatus Lernaella stagnicola]|nr:type I-E CRISPR-associated protein Cse2/CasB [Candidatus Lernaella stagnicola]
MSNPSTKSHEENFVKFLHGLHEAKNRGPLAALRRGLGKRPGTVPETYRYVVPFVGGLSKSDEDCFYLVASLFASHPTANAQGNFGATMRQVYDKQNNSESSERRFVALLNAHVEELPDRLRQAVALAKSNDASVDWSQLLKDLRHWTHESRYVQQNWARSFWGQPQKTKTENAE